MMNKYNPNIHHRRSIRLKGYDYSKAGLYFITICCEDRICRFGQVENGEMILNEFGKIAFDEWLKLSERFPNFELDVFQIMPNHMHGIISLNDESVGAGFTPALNQNMYNEVHTGFTPDQIQKNHDNKIFAGFTPDLIQNNHDNKTFGGFTPDLDQKNQDSEIDIEIRATARVAPTKNHIIPENTEHTGFTTDQNPTIPDPNIDSNIRATARVAPTKNHIIPENTEHIGFTTDQNPTNPDSENDSDKKTTARIVPTVSGIVGAYKSLVSNGCLDIFKSKNETMGKLWQRNYHEHIIRNEQSYQRISEYIINNPAKWNEDKFYRKYKSRLTDQITK